MYLNCTGTAAVHPLYYLLCQKYTESTLCYTFMCPRLCVQCPDRSHGLVFWGQGLPEEQLEHSGRDAGDDFCY